MGQSMWRKHLSALEQLGFDCLRNQEEVITELFGEPKKVFPHIPFPFLPFQYKKQRNVHATLT